MTKDGVSLRQKIDIAVTDFFFFYKKRKCCNHRCPDTVYFKTLLLIINLSAIETLICGREMILIGSTSFGFVQNTIHVFQNTVLNSYWHCLRQMPQKFKIAKSFGPRQPARTAQADVGRYFSQRLINHSSI